MLLRKLKFTGSKCKSVRIPLQFACVHALGHRIRIHRRATRVGAFEVFEAAHVALRTLLAFSQPVNCIFWPIGMLNWLVAASKLHKHRETCCTAEWPFYSFLILCSGVLPCVVLSIGYIIFHSHLFRLHLQGTGQIKSACIEPCKFWPIASALNHSRVRTDASINFFQYS